KAEILCEKLGRDARGLKDHRQSAPRMRTTADEINALQILEAITWSQAQHLVERVRQAERRPLMQIESLRPVLRREDDLRANAATQVGHAEPLEPLERSIAKWSTLALPIDFAVHVRYRHQHIKAAHARRRQRRIERARIVHVER